MKNFAREASHLEIFNIVPIKLYPDLVTLFHHLCGSKVLLDIERNSHLEK